MPKNALCTQYKFYGLEIRMNTGLSATNALDYAYALIDYGDSTTSGAYNVATMPGYMLFSHCVMGGRALTDDNKWRPYNLGRMIYDNGKGCGILDSYNVEHGAQGGYGSDRGIWNGVAAQGPVWIKNNATDFGGGISLMYGGADPPVGTPNCEDIEISHNWMVRDQVYNPSNMTKRYVDALGGTCTWTSKNQFETKGGKRTYVHHNVFEGFWMDGQLAQIMLKAANQETGNNDPDNTVDLAFVDNLCVGGGIGINISTRESNIAYTINGIRHLQVGRNVVLCGLTTTYPSTYGALSCHAMQIGFGSSAQPAGCLDTEDISFLNNATEVSGEAGGLGATLFVTSVVFGPVGKSVSYNRNVSMQVYPQLYTEIRADSGSFGTNYVFDAARYRAGTVVTVADNVSARAAESNGSAFNSAQYFVADLAAMGLTKTALLGEYVQSPTSFLRTGGVGGVRIGPDYDMLNALRPFIISGNLV